MSKPNHIEGEGELRLSLPWPDKLLGPNARVHWRRKAPLTKSARRTAWALTLEAGAKAVSVSAAPRVVVVFRPPDQRRRDADNCMASLKASLDGIADALGVDDSRFITTFSMGSSVKGGSVEVTIARAA